MGRLKRETNEVLNQGVKKRKISKKVKDNITNKKELAKQKRRKRELQKIQKLYGIEENELKEVQLIYGIFTLKKDEYVLVTSKYNTQYKGKVIKLYNDDGNISFDVSITSTRIKHINESEISNIRKIKKTHTVLH